MRSPSNHSIAQMDIHRLVKMANEIGTFFEGAEHHHEAVASIAAHLRNFWDPRMRSEIIQYARMGDGELRDIVREAVLTIELIHPPN
jgi:formate dehydrogenase subunit delta